MNTQLEKLSDINEIWTKIRKGINEAADRHQFLAFKRKWVILIDLTLLNTNMATKLLHHPPLKSKTTFVVKYISGMTRHDRENRCLSN